MPFLAKNPGPEDVAFEIEINGICCIYSFSLLILLFLLHLQFFAIDPSLFDKVL